MEVDGGSGHRGNARRGEMRGGGACDRGKREAPGNRYLRDREEEKKDKHREKNENRDREKEKDKHREKKEDRDREKEKDKHREKKEDRDREKKGDRDGEEKQDRRGEKSDNKQTDGEKKDKTDGRHREKDLYQEHRGSKKSRKRKAEQKLKRPESVYIDVHDLPSEPNCGSDESETLSELEESVFHDSRTVNTKLRVTDDLLEEQKAQHKRRCYS